MKRTALRRSSSLKVKRNKDGRPKERFEHLRLEDFREWIRNRPCLISNGRCRYEEHRSDAAHVESKARGAGDIGNLAPLCRAHHREQHDHGPRSFERAYKLNLREVAGALWIQFEREKGVATL